MNETAAVIRDYYHAYANGNRQAMEDLLRNDFVFSSPYDDRINRFTYFEKCWPMHEAVRRLDIEQLMSEGEVACVLYEIENKSGERSRNMEFLKVRDGRIKEIQSYFGEFGEESRIQHDSRGMSAYARF